MRHAVKYDMRCPFIGGNIEKLFQKMEEGFTFRGHSQSQRSKIKLFQWCSVVQDVKVHLVVQSFKVRFRKSLQSVFAFPSLTSHFAEAAVTLRCLHSGQAFER